MKKLKRFSKRKALVISTLTLFVLAGLYTLLVIMNTWFNEHKFIFQSPVTITFNKPVQVVKRELLRPQIIEVYNELPTIKDLTPIEEYICDKWGPYDCKVALSIARTESGMRADAIGINANSVDLGIYQINSVHYKKPGCSLQEVADPYKNVDCAYSIWLEQGWNPWTVWKSGAFKENL